MTFREDNLIFSVNCFLAAMLALWIGFSMGLPRPYWAMLTVYIVSQPLTGALRSKALYRVIGTAAGGVAAIAIVPTFVNAPALMAVVMAGWVGLCLYLSLLDRTPRAYVFMLAGYTTAIIGFPAWGRPRPSSTPRWPGSRRSPSASFARPWSARSSCRGMSAGSSASGSAASLRTASGIADALTSGPGAAERQERRRLAADVTELHVAATHLPFDTCNLPLRVNTVRALETRLAYMLPLISTLEDRLSQLGPRDGASSRLLSDVVAWAKDEDAGEAEVLRERCRRLTPVIDSDSGWDA